MEEREYNQLMKKALSSEVHWRAQIATDDGVEEMRTWLSEAIKRVKTDLTIRQAELSAVKATHGQRSTRYRHTLVAFQRWHASAIRFSSMAHDRLNQLPPPAKPKPRPTTNARREPKPDVLVRAHEHSERMSLERNHMRLAVIELAKTVRAFERGDATIRDLGACLDDLTVPDSNGEITLRALLDLLND